MKHPGFTLIELLVVIAIIALLMSVLVPSLHIIRQHAKAILCQSNLKQLALGLVIYENDNETFPYSLDNTRFDPPPGGHLGDPSCDRIGWWWLSHITDYSEEYFDRKSIVKCPSREINKSRLKNNVLCSNYGLNQSICKIAQGDGDISRAEFAGKPLRSCDISRPGETLLVLDSGYSMINWWHVTDVPPVSLGNTIIEDAAYVPGLEINKEKNLWPGQEQDAINGRHPNRTVNVGFADGHVSRVKADHLFVEKIDDGYKNRRPLWVPE
jgi:prepilin-type N-terminal cleavage/methylation domain-containing protein/prepilin-type processing-associated H-X9-DG protein